MINLDSMKKIGRKFTGEYEEGYIDGWNNAIGEIEGKISIPSIHDLFVKAGDKFPKGLEGLTMLAGARIMYDAMIDSMK